jgi:glycosyltransferase involved in cell wall biosynthesis
VPVVCSDLPQTRDLVKKGGYTADVGDDEAFADRITACLDGSYPHGGREHIVDAHAWEDTVSRTTAVLETIGRQ